MPKTVPYTYQVLTEYMLLSEWVKVCVLPHCDKEYESYFQIYKELFNYIIFFADFRESDLLLLGGRDQICLGPPHSENKITFWVLASLGILVKLLLLASAHS